MGKRLQTHWSEDDRQALERAVKRSSQTPLDGAHASRPGRTGADGEPDILTNFGTQFKMAF